MFLLHGRQIHGLLDHFIVIRNLIAIDRLGKGPCGAVVLHIVQKMQQLVVVGPVAWLARQLIHVWRPPRLLDRWDTQRIDLAWSVSPLLGRIVDYMRATKCANLRVHCFPLLQYHAAYLQIPYLGEHRALHNGTSLIILNISHPERFFKCDFLRKALLFEIPNCVVIRIGQKVHNGRCRFYIVLQQNTSISLYTPTLRIRLLVYPYLEMRHQVRSVSLDLLVRRDGAKDNFSKTATIEWPVRNAPACALAGTNVAPPSQASCVHTQPPPTDASQLQ